MLEQLRVTGFLMCLVGVGSFHRSKISICFGSDHLLSSSTKVASCIHSSVFTASCLGSGLNLPKCRELFFLCCSMSAEIS